MYRSVTSDVHLLEQRKILPSALHALPLQVARKSTFPVIETLAQSVTHNTSYDLSKINAHSLDWLLDCLAFTVQDVLDTADIEDRLVSIKYCVNIYSDWLSFFVDPNDCKSKVPTPIIENPNHYVKVIIWHLYHVFNQRGTNENFIGWQSFYCKKILRLLESMCRIVQFDNNKEIVLLTIAVTDRIVRRQPDDKSNLIPVLSESVFRIWLQTAEKEQMTLSLWKTFYILSDCWVDSNEILNEWGLLVIQLSNQIINSTLDIIRTSSLVNLFKMWYRFLFMFADPISSIKNEDNLMLFLQLIDQITNIFQNYSSLNSTFHLFSHWVFRVCFTKHFKQGRSIAVRYMYTLLTSRNRSSYLTNEYVIRLIYLTYDLLNDTDLLWVLISHGTSIYRLYNIPKLMITIPRVFHSLTLVDTFENRGGCIHFLLSGFCYIYHWNLPDRADLNKLLIKLLEKEMEPEYFRCLLCIIRLVDVSEKKVKPSAILDIVCECMLTRWSDNYQIGLSCIQYLTLCAAKYGGLPIKCLISLCRYIKTQLNKQPFRHVRQMHTAVVLAFECLGIPSHSSSLGNENVISNLAEVIKLGMVGTSSQVCDDKHPASRRVEQAAYRLIDRLINKDQRWEGRNELFGNGFAMGNQHIITTNQFNAKNAIAASSYTNCSHTKWIFTAEQNGRNYTSFNANFTSADHSKLPEITSNSFAYQELEVLPLMFKKELDSFNRCIKGTSMTPKSNNKLPTNLLAKLPTNITKLFMAQWDCLALKNITVNGLNYFRPVIFGDTLEDTFPKGLCAIFYIRSNCRSTVEFRGNDYLSNSRLDRRFYELIKALGHMNVLIDDNELNKVTLREVDGISCELIDKTSLCNIKYIVASDLVISMDDLSITNASCSSLTLSIVYFEEIEDVELFCQCLEQSITCPICAVCFTSSGLCHISIINGSPFDLPLTNNIVVQPSILAQCIQELAEMICWRESFEVNERNSGCAERRIKIQKWIYKHSSNHKGEGGVISPFSIAYFQESSN